MLSLESARWSPPYFGFALKCVNLRSGKGTNWSVMGWVSLYWEYWVQLRNIQSQWQWACWQCNSRRTAHCSTFHWCLLKGRQDVVFTWNYQPGAQQQLQPATNRRIKICKLDKADRGLRFRLSVIPQYLTWGIWFFSPRPAERPHCIWCLWQSK